MISGYKIYTDTLDKRNEPLFQQYEMGEHKTLTPHLQEIIDLNLETDFIILSIHDMKSFPDYKGNVLEIAFTGYRDNIGNPQNVIFVTYEGNIDNTSMYSLLVDFLEASKLVQQRGQFKPWRDTLIQRNKTYAQNINSIQYPYVETIEMARKRFWNSVVEEHGSTLTKWTITSMLDGKLVHRTEDKLVYSKQGYIEQRYKYGLGIGGIK